MPIVRSPPGHRVVVGLSSVDSRGAQEVAARVGESHAAWGGPEPGTHLNDVDLNRSTKAFCAGSRMVQVPAALDTGWEDKARESWVGC